MATVLRVTPLDPDGGTVEVIADAGNGFTVTLVVHKGQMEADGWPALLDELVARRLASAGIEVNTS